MTTPVTETTTMFLVEDQLVSLLGERLAGQGVRVDHSIDLQSADTIGFGSTKGRRQIATMRAGRKAREETYSLDMHIYTVRKGKTHREALESAVSHLSVVEELLAEDPSLGLNELHPTLRVSTGDFELETYIEANGGWRVHVVQELDVAVRLA